MVLSGGHDPEFSAPSSAEAMRRFMMALGVPDSALLLEPHSCNTTQNAIYTANLLGERGISTYLLTHREQRYSHRSGLFKQHRNILRR